MAANALRKWHPSSRLIHLAQRRSAEDGERVVLESPGSAHHDADLGLRQGILRWSMQRGGTRGEIGVAGDPSAKTWHCNLTAPLPGAGALQGFGHARRSHTAGRREHFETASLSLRRPLGGGFTAQPGFYVVAVESGDRSHWFGRNLRVEYRGAELFLNDEGDRGRRAAARKIWRPGAHRFTLGAELAHHRSRPDRAVIEVGAARGGVGVDVYPGNGRAAILLHAGALHAGVGRRDGARQVVAAVGGMSLSFTTHANGTSEAGLGFVWRGVARTVLRNGEAWSWQAPVPQSALTDPRIRWPALAAL
jgi:hypothetical protein